MTNYLMKIGILLKKLKNKSKAMLSFTPKEKSIPLPHTQKRDNKDDLPVASVSSSDHSVSSLVSCFFLSAATLLLLLLLIFLLLLIRFFRFMVS